MVSSASEFAIRVQRRITAAIAAGTTGERLLAHVTRSAAQLCRSDMAAIALMTVGGHELEFMGVFGTRAPMAGMRVLLAGSLNGLVVTSGRNLRRTNHGD